MRQPYANKISLSRLKLVSLLTIILIFHLNIKGQCLGSWSNVNNTYNYLCANGPYTEVNLGSGICPTSPQCTYTFNAPNQSVQVFFSAFGTGGFADESRMAFFLNGNKIDLALACQINLSCQSPAGNYLISNGCLSDYVSGADGGLSGYVILTAAAFSLPSISSIGIATSEPGASGTIFEIGACDTACNATKINTVSTFQTLPYLFPNPTVNEVTIRLPNANSNYRVTVINQIGEIVKIIDIQNTNSYTLRKEQYYEGLFFITIEDGKQNVFKDKIIFH